jgi:hypothetical protein
MTATNDDLFRILTEIDKKLFILVGCKDSDEIIADTAAFKTKEAAKVKP